MRALIRDFRIGSRKIDIKNKWEENLSLFLIAFSLPLKINLSLNFNLKKVLNYLSDLIFFSI